MPFNVNRGMLAVDERLYNLNSCIFREDCPLRNCTRSVIKHRPVVKSGSHRDYYGYLNFDRHLANLDVFKRVLTSVAVFAYSEVRIHVTLKENMAKDV